MSDPRENKLPKWAQELLQKERLKNALCLSRPCPEPDWTADVNGFPFDDKPPKGQVLYSPSVSFLKPPEVVFDGWNIIKGSAKYRASGPYFIHRNDALDYMAHQCAMTAAAKILEIEELREQPHE